MYKHRIYMSTYLKFVMRIRIHIRPKVSDSQLQYYQICTLWSNIFQVRCCRLNF